ncbi:DUF7666 domain-containing protein [Shinella zoogloeoides]|uniref:DUF7666 domain-containing protein n=1 Tax=Shinella zoogloeoides TaxID=352475 RepID=UPI001F573A08|nr:hypothetical protein [Shinella zoogloeoides]
MAKRSGDAEEARALTTYKGFNKDMTCTPSGVRFQYEVGKTYTTDKKVTRCGAGAFHSVLMPLDAWNYYGPATSVFALTTASGDVADDPESDTKIASASISIDMELHLPDFIKKAVAWIKEAAKESVTTGYRAHAASTGYRAHAASTGYRAHAASTGYRAHAASTGNGAHAASTGNGAHAASTGYRAHAASTGDYAHAASTGYRAHAASTGDYAHAASTGNGAHAASTGDYAHAASTGNGAHAASTGYRAHAASTGNGAHAASTGYRAHAASTGNGAISAALGARSTAKAEVGGAIMLAHYDETVWPHNLLAVRASLVGQNGIEAGKAYRLTANGEFEEVKE